MTKHFWGTLWTIVGTGTSHLTTQVKDRAAQRTNSVSYPLGTGHGEAIRATGKKPLLVGSSAFSELGSHEAIA